MVARRKGSTGLGGRFRIPDVYGKLLAGWCRERARLDPRLDPRLWLGEHSPTEWALLRWLDAESQWQAEQDLAVMFAAGEPLEVPRGTFGGHSIPREGSWPAWLGPYSAVKSVRVYADDTIEPVDQD